MIKDKKIIQSINICMNNLTEREQMELWSNLWKFADEKLPANKKLKIMIITNKDFESKVERKNEMYLKGFQDGWEQCRNNIIEMCDLDKDKIIAMERSDADWKYSMR